MKWRREYEYQNTDQEFSRQDEWYLMKRLEILAEDEEARLNFRNSEEEKREDDNGLEVKLPIENTVLDGGEEKHDKLFSHEKFSVESDDLEIENDSNNKNPGRKERKAQLILTASRLMFADEYANKEHPVALKIKRKHAKKYWEYFAQYLLDSWQIGKNESGVLVPYKYEELSEINEGSDEFVVVYAQGKANTTAVTGATIQPANEATVHTNTADVKQLEEEFETSIEFAESPVGRYHGTPRTDIKPFVGLTAEQKKQYNWDATYLKFAAVNKDQSPTTIAQFTRRALADGWTESDAVPNIHDVYDVGIVDGVRVIEAYSGDNAFAYAYKKKATDPGYTNFQWQTKIEQKRGYIQNPVMGSFEAGWNLENLRNKPQVNFQQLKNIAGDDPNAQLYLDAINAQPTYNDKIRSEAFVSLVKLVQTKIAADTGKDTPPTGIYDNNLVLGYIAGEKQKQADAAAYEKTLSNLTVGVYDTNTKLTHYKIEGRDIYVYEDDMWKLKELCATGKYDPITTFLNDYRFPGTDQKMKDLLYTLTPSERLKVLLAYNSASFYLDIEEERIVNATLANVPPSMTGMLKNNLVQYNYYLYTSLRDFCENTETRKDFYTATAALGITIDDQKVINAAKENNTKENINTADNQLNEMSPEQIGKIAWVDRKLFFDNYIHGTIGLAIYEYSIDELIRTTPPADHAKLREYLLTDDKGIKNFYHLVRLEQLMSSSNWDEVQPYLDSFFANDFDALLILSKAVYTEIDTDFEALMYNVPKSVFARLLSIEKVTLIKKILEGSFTDTYDEASILKILDTVGREMVFSEIGSKEKSDGINKEEYQWQAKTVPNESSDFYKLLTETYVDHVNLVVKLRDVFQWDNHTALQENLGNLNPDVAAQKNDVTNAGSGEKDEKIAQMGDKAMELLSLEEREEYILNLCGWEKMSTTPSPVQQRRTDYYMCVGTTWWENVAALVGDMDETSIVRIIGNAPPDQAQPLLSWMANNGGKIYNIIDGRVHGAEFSDLHEELLMKALQVHELDANKKGTLETSKGEMEGQRTAHKNSAGDQDVVPWADPGIVKFTMGMHKSFAYDYEVSFTAAGLVKVVYETEMPSPSTAGGWTTIGSTSLEFQPWDIIGVDFKEDDDELHAKKGELRLMAAINLFELVNKQFKQRTMEVVDLATMALGVGELLVAVKASQIILASINIGLSAGNLIMGSYRKNIPDSVFYAWQAVNVALGGYFGIKLLVKGVAVTGKAAMNLARGSALTMMETADNAENAIRQLKALLTEIKEPAAMEAMKNEIMRMESQVQLLRDINKMKLDEVNDMRKAVTENPNLAPEAKFNLLNAVNDQEALLKSGTGNPKTIDVEKPAADLPPKTKQLAAGDFPATNVDAGQWKAMHFIKRLKSTREIVEENAHITHNGMLMKFVKKGKDGQWEFIKVGEEPVPEMAIRLEDELNQKGVDDVMKRVKEGTIDGVMKQDVYHTAKTLSVQGIIDAIDPNYFNSESRFGLGFYVAELGNTSTLELSHHMGNAYLSESSVIRMEMDMTQMKILDLTNPEIAKEWNLAEALEYELQMEKEGKFKLKYSKFQEIAVKAKSENYNAIHFNSLRGEGANFVILEVNKGFYKEALKPQMVMPATN